ncbi:MAG: DUF192 domain-containing protein [Candidatus Melainabacteria bacterium]|nr:DUF192 domain-containing protein [Candidatus Melainabacteria bacterium]
MKQLITTVFLELADSSDKMSRGLANRLSLESNHGMLFIIRPSMSVFVWMKDTLIPLDIIFIDNGIIVKIIKNTVPKQIIPRYPSDFSVTEMVEVNAGFTDEQNIEVGNEVVFGNIEHMAYSNKSYLMIVTK